MGFGPERRSPCSGGGGSPERSALALEHLRGSKEAALSQGLRNVTDDEQHRLLERDVVDDRNVVAIRGLEEVLLDPQDGVEIVEVAVGAAVRALAINLSVVAPTTTGTKSATDATEELRRAA